MKRKASYSIFAKLIHSNYAEGDNVDNAIVFNIWCTVLSSLSLFSVWLWKTVTETFPFAERAGGHKQRGLYSGLKKVCTQRNNILRSAGALIVISCSISNIFDLKGPHGIIETRCKGYEGPQDKQVQVELNCDWFMT